ncbi:WYL domain-containing protein [Paenibacillus anseongense]|uniref:helix-turn-helix transcriptional regulator n=1 Tax=Paenibacillus anseongense TaxID=2682845 RepID=UPI002DBF0348|nr:WYL domain-containing protein [Paenibacillus anseongense]MEC0269727.1 WYL domain-containing protein [Paenibacillus anseongense]
MIDKVIRLFKMLNAIQANPGITAKELAIKCDTAERTIYRDLRVLDLIAPVTNEGYGKGYTFMGNFSMYPLNFTEQEAMVLSMLPSVVDKHKLPDGFETAYDKVMATHLKEKSRNKDIVQNITDAIQMGMPAYKEETTQNFLFDILQAILGHKTIEAVYHTQSRNTETKRSIDPYYLVPRDKRFYLIGFCHRAQAIRTFRLSRFKAVDVTNLTYSKGDFSIKQYLKNTWSIERGEEHIQFKVKFSPAIARYIKEEELFVRPKMRDLPNGSLIFEVTLNHDREFLNWVYQYGPNAEILEPKSYRETMKEQLQAWMNVYK